MPAARETNPTAAAAFPLATLRNFGLCAHIDAGKTTLSEHILHLTGLVHVPGSVDAGTAVLDDMDEERSRGITIRAAATICPWRRGTRGYHLNLIDTPGHVDFTMEVERSMRVLDGVVILFDAREGVEAQSETVWRQADRYRVPRLAFINKMDRVGADLARCLESMRRRLETMPLPVQMPIGEAGTFAGIIDLVEMRAYAEDADASGGLAADRDVPDAVLEEARRRRRELIECAAGLDDELAEAYLDDDADLTVAMIRAAIRRATIRGACVPVLCGSALRGIGARQVLDAVVDYLPDPGELPDVTGIDPKNVARRLVRRRREDAPLAALVFKVSSEDHGDLAFVRVYSGRLEKGTRVLNPTRGRKEIVGRIVEIHAKRREAVAAAGAGRIVAVLGLKHSVTGDTLCAAAHPIVLERMDFPEPVVSLSIEPATNADRDRLWQALDRIRREDPTFRAAWNEETGQTLIEGMGELHLQIIQNRLVRDMRIGVRVGTPRVSYRETITGSARRVPGRFAKQIGPKRHFAEVVIDVAPITQAEAIEAGLEMIDGVVFTDRTDPETLARENVPLVAAGARAAATSGALAGYPVVGVRIDLVGAVHDEDSTPLAFEQAGAIAFRAACTQAGLAMLEPMTRLTITTPEEHLGAVTGDLATRRGQILDMTSRDDRRIIRAEVPLAETFGFADALRSLTHGRASSEMEPAGHRVRPAGT